MPPLAHRYRVRLDIERGFAAHIKRAIDEVSASSDIRGLFNETRIHDAERTLYDNIRSVAERSGLAVVTDVFFPTFAEAAAVCGHGYDDPDIADVIAFKAAQPVNAREIAPEQAVNSIQAVALAAAELTARPLKILDFGGGCGFHYFRVAAALHVPVRWAIVETPIMASRAATLGEGRFEVFTDLAAAAKALGKVDLVHASSAVQYVPEPLVALRALAALHAPHFMLARLPCWYGAQTVDVQISSLADNGIGPLPPAIADRPVKYPITFPNFDEVARILRDYDIAVSTLSPSSNYVLRGQQIPGINLMLRAKTNGPRA